MPAAGEAAGRGCCRAGHWRRRAAYADACGAGSGSAWNQQAGEEGGHGARAAEDPEGHGQREREEAAASKQQKASTKRRQWDADGKGEERLKLAMRGYPATRRGERHGYCMLLVLPQRPSRPRLHRCGHRCGHRSAPPRCGRRCAHRHANRCVAGAPTSAVAGSTASAAVAATPPVPDATLDAPRSMHCAARTSLNAPLQPRCPSQHDPRQANRQAPGREAQLEAKAGAVDNDDLDLQEKKKKRCWRSTTSCC